MVYTHSSATNAVILLLPDVNDCIILLLPDVNDCIVSLVAHNRTVR